MIKPAPGTALTPPFEVRVVGEPATQGSKFAIPGRHPGDRPILLDDNKRLKPWRATMLNTFLRRLDALRVPPPDWDIPLGARLVVMLPRLRRDARIRDEDTPLPFTGLDLDKLQRAVGDSLTDSHVIRDDSRICRWSALKRYARHDEEPGIELYVQPLELGIARCPHCGR